MRYYGSLKWSWAALAVGTALVGGMRACRGQVTIAPVLVDHVGGRTFFDTLATFASAAPTRIDTMPLSELEHNIYGLAPSDSGGRVVFLTTYRLFTHLSLAETPTGITRRVWTERLPLAKARVRAIAAHEFGHLLEYARPELFKQFWTLSPVDVGAGFASAQMARWMASEAFADAFAEAVGRRMSEFESQPYPFYRAFTTIKQRALLEHVVANAEKGLP